MPSPACLETANPVISPGAQRSRWLMVFSGATLQMCLGSVYAWSYFQQSLVDAFQWRHAEVAWTFSLAIGFLGLAAAVGGRYLEKVGPRKLAVTGILLYGTGFLVAALALHWRSLLLLWLGFGVIGGPGLGLGYVTPVATVARWFPERKGLATGIVVMGFGFGALVMSKLLAPALERLFQQDLRMCFAGSGCVLGGVGLAAAMCLRNPPVAAPMPEQTQAPESDEGGPGLISKQFGILWVVFFCNITTGIALIGFQSPLLQDLIRQAEPLRSPASLAAAGATLIAVTSVCNGAGRLFWGTLSDRTGPLPAFRMMLASQALAFGILAVVRSPGLFAGLACYILLCYGGGFGVMPSFVSKVFGPARMPVVYGAILTAWSCAGILGPQWIARLKDSTGVDAAAGAFGGSAALLVAGLLLTWFFREASSTQTSGS